MQIKWFRCRMSSRKDQVRAAAVMLYTGKEKYVLRRRGGNPFRDPALDKLVRKNISVVGNVIGYTFLMSDWSETIKEKS